MLNLRKSADRGATRIDWLDSRHSFSFNDYRDPAFEGFGALRVLNEDRIAAGGGFGEHSHRDMEIVTYVLEGAIRHSDSAGGGGLIRPGEIQRMSAGHGISHAEVNASATEACHLLQIWILPSKKGGKPSYEQKPLTEAALRNHLARIAASEPQANEVRIEQDAEIWAARLDPNIEVIHALERGRRAWLHVARGEVSVDGERLGAGDAAAITDQKNIVIRSHAPSEFLLFDLA